MVTHNNRAMAKYLVIVESPAKAKTIGKYLGKDFEIRASFGHVRDLPDKKLGVDIKHNFEPTYINMKDKQKVLTELKEKAKSKDIIYIATDPDREGEAIAWHIKEAIEANDDKVRRIVFHEITQKALKHAIEHSRDIDFHLVDAQQARRVLDRLIGYKLSPILSKKIRRGLSAGRVQSVAVRLICDREKEILSFIPKEYWVLEGDFIPNKQKKDSFKAKLFAKDTPKNAYEITTEKEAHAVLGLLQQASYAIHDIKTTALTRNPYPPFITSTLQQEASRKLNWSAKRTMMVAQQLYEGVDVDGESLGLITYMRTDSVRIADEAAQAAKQVILKDYGNDYLPKFKRTFKQKKGIQDAHEAIRPTYVDKTPKSLSGKLPADMLKLYTLIWQRFLASQMSSAELESTTVILDGSAKNSGHYFLKATGSVVKFDGFTRLYSESKDDQDDQDNEPKLPKLTTDTPVALKDMTAEQKFTQPPRRYTEATLVKALEEQGIGRPSTYAPTLSVIQDRGYVKKEKKNLFPTDLGMTVNDQLLKFFDNIVDVTFTAHMEDQLDAIIEGKHPWQDVVGEFYFPFEGLLKNANDNMEKLKQDKPSDEICDKCGKPMVIKTGRFGEFLACSGFPECRNTKPLAANLNVSCPECGSAMVEKRSKKGKLFYGCSAFPKCQFATWDKPVAQKCPNCNYPILLEKTTRDKKQVIYCKQCNYSDNDGQKTSESS